MNRKEAHFDPLKPKKPKQYFTEKKLINSMKDLNLQNNVRMDNKETLKKNQEKYIAPIRSDLVKPSKSKEYSYSYTNKDYAEFVAYLDKTNLTKTVNPNMRQELENSINVILKRIKNDYDFDRWSKVDIQNKYNETNDFDFTKGVTTDLPSQAELFTQTIKNKISSLSINKRKKQELISYMNKTSFKEKAKFPQLSTKTGNETETSKFIRRDNEALYRTTQDTFLYRDFPSCTRTEFVKKLGIFGQPHKEFDPTKISTTKYESFKNTEGVFSEDYPKSDFSIRTWKNKAKYF